jgi:hypothetical protein
MPHPVCRRFSLVLVLALVLLALLPPAAAIAEDAKAEAIAERTLEAMGGREAWEATRYLRFNFFGFRLHHWDRHTGDHRLEGKNREGDAYVVVHNIKTREGRSWLNGELQEGDAKAKALEGAYGAWINDTYWLIMPYKLQDPGVELRYDGEEKIDGTVYDKLHLSFESVGLTPGDQYWAYINRETGLMDRWSYFLESYDEDKEPTQWQWLDWRPYGGIQLSSMRRKVEDENERPLGEIAVFEHLDAAVFTSPEPPGGK